MYVLEESEPIIEEQRLSRERVWIAFHQFTKAEESIDGKDLGCNVGEGSTAFFYKVANGQHWMNLTALDHVGSGYLSPRFQITNDFALPFQEYLWIQPLLEAWPFGRSFTPATFFKISTSHLKLQRSGRLYSS